MIIIPATHYSPGSPFEFEVVGTGHEYHAHVSGHVTAGHAPHVSHSHVSHRAIPPAPPPPPFSNPAPAPALNQKSGHRHSHQVTRTLQQSRHLVQGNLTTPK